MSAPLFETHCHLTDPQFDMDRNAVFARAKDAGVGAMVEIAESPESWDKARDLAGGVNGIEVYWACGFHPHYADRLSGFDMKVMKEKAAHSSCVAVGEVGLDYCKSTTTKEDQAALFRATLEIAADLNKPVIIHCRDAQQDTLRILNSFFGGMSRRDLAIGVIHCFSGDIHFAQGCIDLGFYVGVDGPVTYPGAKALREVLAEVPLDRVVLETDCPYLPPQQFRGKRNEPSYIKHVAEKLAEVHGKNYDEICAATHSNARKLFRIHG